MTQQISVENPASRLFATGALAILVGIIVLAWPGITLGVIAVSWGIFAIADGVATLFLSKEDHGSVKVLRILSGIIGILAGISVVFQPFFGMAVLTWVLGIWLIARGVLEIVGAFSATDTKAKIILILAGILWIFAGIVVTANPGIAMINMVYWLGVLAVIWGIAFIVAGFMQKSKN